MLVSVVLGVACGAHRPSGDDERAIAIYTAVLRDVAARSPVDAPTTAPSEPVFVVAADPTSPISLEVQAGIVDSLHDFATIRFVDERSEAIDVADPVQPVHEGGILVTLGEIPPGATAVTVEGQRYERAGVATAFRITLRRTGETWRPVAPPVR